MLRKALAVTILTAIALAGCSKRQLNEENLLASLQAHFADHGMTICTDQFSLPVINDVSFGGASAQLEALGKVGLVSVTRSVQNQGWFKTINETYALTSAARKSADVHIGQRSDSGTGAEQHYVVFCYGTITPKKVSNIQKQQGPPIPGLNGVFVSADYTYAVNVRPWARNAAVRKAFPAIDDAVTNASRSATAQFTQDTNKNWVVQTDGLNGAVR